eukprot:5619125-Pyramimonas_sp.AAC.1
MRKPSQERALPLARPDPNPSSAQPSPRLRPGGAWAQHDSDGTKRSFQTNSITPQYNTTKNIPIPIHTHIYNKTTT